MTANQLDIINELRGGRLYSSAILGTYTFDGNFFEHQVLPLLNELDVTNITVLTDRQSYTAADDLTEAGQSYYIDHVRCHKIHHPKYVALLGNDHGRAFIGSANLTQAGWRQNAELMTVVEYPGDTAATRPVFATLREFITGTLEQVYSSRVTAGVEEAFRDAPWLPESPQGASSDSLQLLHNHDEAILSQLLDRVGNHSISSVEICSPVFSGGDEAVIEALSSVNPEEVRFNIQPDQVDGFDSAVLSDPCLDGTDVTVNRIALAGDGTDRYIHAKLLVLKGPGGAWALYGSPNVTTPALIETSDSGNVELGILRHEPDPDYFDYLLDRETVTREAVAPESVTYRPPDFASKTGNQPDFYLTDARLESDGTLVIEHAEDSPDGAKVTLRQATGGDELTMDVSDPGRDQITCEGDQMTQLCRRSVQVKLGLQYQDTAKISDRRWVSLPALKRTVRPSEAQTVEESDGRHGLLDILDRLPSWGVICDFLQEVDFSSGDLTVGSGPIGGGDLGGNGDGIEERSLKARDEILDDKVTTLHDKLEETREKLVHDPGNERIFRSFVNQYVALAKLTLWWVSQEQNSISHLSKIRQAHLTVIQLTSSLARGGDLARIKEVEADCALIEHAAIVMCFTDELHRQAGYDTGTNHEVYATFQETHRELLESFERLRGSAIPDTDRIAEHTGEYAAIGTVSVRGQRVKYYCKNLLDADG